MNKKDIKKIGVVGAGPAGLAAAVTIEKLLCHNSALKDWRVEIFEKNSDAGKKLLATGNGKCNITNEYADGFQICKDFFEDLGILLKKDRDGRMYPHSGQAKIVRDILVKAVQNGNARILSEKTIEQIHKHGNGFIVKDSDKIEYYYDKLIIATGGKAGMQYGSVGDGYRFARDLGLAFTPVLPVLVPMIYGQNPGFELNKLKGVRATVDLNLFVEGRNIAKEHGEIQFTDYGISGICIFDLSRFLRSAPKKNNDMINTVVKVDFAPEHTIEELRSLFKSKTIAGLKGVVNEKIERVLVDAGFDPNTRPKETAEIVKDFSINISGTKGWKEAQSTSGGVTLKEINMKTMESIKIKNLFFAGELLDYDGPCGGYNLSWAWKTGINAGLGVVKSITVGSVT